MTIAFVLLAQVGHYPNVPNGIDIATLGKLRPGNYTATRDRWSMAKIATLPAAKRKTFDGCLFVLDSPKKGQAKTIVFVKGKRISYEHPGQPKPTSDTFATVLKALPVNTDIRYGAMYEGDFTLRLPDEAEKLRGFQGTLMWFAKTVSSRDMLTVGIKSGKVVSVRQGK